MAVGSAMTGRGADRHEVAALARSGGACVPEPEPAGPFLALAGVGTTRLPASVGVEARQSATWSSRGVDVVPDRADHRGARGRDGAEQRLVAEGEVLDRATATADDDDVDARVGIELLQGGSDLGNGGGTLDRDLADGEADRGPARRVLHDVLLGRAGPPTDQPDRARQERQRLLPVRVEQALGRKRALEVLDASEQLPDPYRADLPGVEHERTPLGPEHRLWPGHDPGALG